MDALKAALNANSTDGPGKKAGGVQNTGADLIKRAMQEELRRKLQAKKLKAQQSGDKNEA